MFDEITNYNGTHMITNTPTNMKYEDNHQKEHVAKVKKINYKI